MKTNHKSALLIGLNAVDQCRILWKKLDKAQKDALQFL
jgi:hypothetical protein